MNACYQGILLNLPMEKQFWYAYVVPYNTKITRIINGHEMQKNELIKLNFKWVIKVILN